MDDIYDWSSKFAERLDDLEEVKFSCNSSVYNKSANDEFFLPSSVHVGCHLCNQKQFILKGQRLKFLLRKVQI